LHDVVAEGVETEEQLVVRALWLRLRAWVLFSHASQPDWIRSLRRSRGDREPPVLLDASEPALADALRTQMPLFMN
jgi:hypothetical protein